MACNLVTSIGNHPMNVLKYFQILKFTRICIQYLLHSKDQKQKIRFYITTKLSNVLLAPAAVKAQSSEIISPFLNLSTIYFTFLFLFHLVSRLPSLISPTHLHPPLSCRLPSTCHKFTAFAKILKMLSPCYSNYTFKNHFKIAS